MLGGATLISSVSLWPFTPQVDKPCLIKIRFFFFFLTICEFGSDGSVTVHGSFMNSALRYVKVEHAWVTVWFKFDRLTQHDRHWLTWLAPSCSVTG